MSVTLQTFDEPGIRRIDSWLTVGGVTVSVILFPFVLAAFHASVGPNKDSLTNSGAILGALWLVVAFAIPAICLFSALRIASRPIATPNQQKALRLSYFGIVAPTAYTFLGVVLDMLGSPVLEKWIWVAVWLLFAAWALAPVGAAVPRRNETKMPVRLRVAHGVAATLIAIYVLFHLTNHFFGLFGPDWHAAIMKLGRRVYRAPVVEPLLVALLLFQVGSGLVLAWRWSGRSAEAFRVFQVASGFYLSIFIVGHMDSVFIYARSYLGIETDWGFAIGAPTGIIHDPWNIRLLPHYWLGVFFVLSHLASGLRVILSTHGLNQTVVSRAWAAGLVASALIASVILAGMCGLRVGSIGS
jgi:hypothetical protein